MAGTIFIAALYSCTFLSLSLFLSLSGRVNLKRFLTSSATKAGQQQQLPALGKMDKKQKEALAMEGPPRRGGCGGAPAPRPCGTR